MRNKLPTRYDANLKDRLLAGARALVQRNLEPGTFINGAVQAAPLHPASARPLVLAMLRDHASRSAWSLFQVVRWAREGVDEAHQVLGELAAEYANRREPPPPVLVGYGVEQFQPPIRRRTGPGPTKSFAQDICICLLVKWLTEIYPIRPTRNGRSSAKPSACSIMATALAEAGIHRGGEAAVQKIWMNYRDLVMSQPPLAMLLSAA